MATHDLFRAKEAGTRVGIIEHGRLVATLETREIGHADLERIYLEHTGVRVESTCQNCNFSQIRCWVSRGPSTQILFDGQPLFDNRRLRLIRACNSVQGATASLASTAMLAS